MGMSYQDAVRLGIGHLHPAIAGGKSRERELLDSLEPKPSSKAPADGMTKLERAFAEMLATQDLQFWTQSIKFRLAGRTWYTPDFMVISRGWLVFVEVKGFMRDDAAVKLKVAAEMYPCFRWLLVYRDGRHAWEVHEVTRAGIGVHTITVPWINGGTV
jgi:hypothetical protein